MMKAAKILERNKVDKDVSLVISPGSSKIMRKLAENGVLGIFIESGARILESACGPCIGMGQAPKSGGVSLRTFNRNFKGRSGTKDAEVYLVSPETAAISAIKGVITNPSSLHIDLNIEEPDSYGESGAYFIEPKSDGKPIVKGPNIKEVPVGDVLKDKMTGRILIITPDNTTTDDICPSNAKLLPLRSNIPELSKYAFTTFTDDFKSLADEYGGGFIIGGENYGQGSSREHAALVPLYLGVRAVIAKSFARIHFANLINSGILPLTFKNKGDYDNLSKEDEIELNDVINSIKYGKEICIINHTKNIEIKVLNNYSKRQIEVLLEGGYLNYVKKN